MIKLNLTDVKFAHKKFIRNNENMIAGILDKTSEFALKYVVDNNKFKSDKMVKATTAKVRLVKRGGKLIIANPKKHAEFQEYGTRGPYDILPRKKKFLRFNIGGKVVFARRVIHPGLKATKFLYKTANASGRIIEENLRREMEKISHNF